MDIPRTLQGILSRRLDMNTTAVFLFGSRARGIASPRSDYDIGVWTDRPIPLFTLAKIEGDIEDAMVPAAVDIVDFSRLSDDFKELALKNIELWNKPRKSPDSTKI